MLALDSPRWATLTSSAGVSGTLAARLLQDFRSGDASGLAELYQQCCHQLTVSEVAYAVVPHLIQITEGLAGRDRVVPLVITGTVAACCAAFPGEVRPVPDDLKADYAEAARPALRMATAALNEPGWRRGEVVELLAVVAALQGHCDLAIHLFLHGGSDNDLSCPECGEYIRWREDAAG